MRIGLKIAAAGLSLFILPSTVLFAQQALTLRDAIAAGLSRNYQLQVYADSARIAANNNTAGNAGMLPQVSTGAGLSYADNKLHQAFAGRADFIKAGVVSTGKVANVNVNYTLFDGLRMFATRRRLRELETLADLNLRLQMESTVSQIMLSYYSLVRAILSQHVSLEAIRIDDERIKIAGTRFQVGAGNKIDLLQATVDRNQDQSILLSQQATVDSARVYLNQLMARDPNTVFEPADTSLQVQFRPTYTQVIDSAEKKNYTLKASLSLVRISNYTLQQVKGSLYPLIYGSAGYFYSRTTNTAGFSLFNQNIGPQLGLNLSWNLFDGFNARRRLANARLSVHASDLGSQNTASLVLAGIDAQYKTFESTLTLLGLEEENIKVAQENLDIALAKYRLGASTQLELMTAQQSLVASLNRLVTARYRTKTAETSLLRLTGSLIN